MVTKAIERVWAARISDGEEEEEKRVLSEMRYEQSQPENSLAAKTRKKPQRKGAAST